MSVRGRRTSVVLTALAALALAASTPAAARYHGNVNLFVGEKLMDKQDWDPVEDQPEFGVMFAFGLEHSPVHFAMDILYSQKDSVVDSPFLGPVDVKSSSAEYAIGVRKVWDLGAFHPLVGAGGCLVAVNLDYDAPGFHPHYADNAYGLWIEGGLSWRLAGHMNLGLDARYTHADARFMRNGLPVDIAAGGLHAGVLLGYGW
ncbi:MAG TPA: hypothetical protein VFV19_13245 [Candidatus Polarisedimenticolaceae bacterium]|nr:hypothetical protein [Candidatus Polarisedimenticolaceae bacterium]